LKWETDAVDIGLTTNPASRCRNHGMAEAAFQGPGAELYLPKK